jgi:hypothetical protein
LKNLFEEFLIANATGPANSCVARKKFDVDELERAEPQARIRNLENNVTKRRGYVPKGRSSVRAATDRETCLQAFFCRLQKGLPDRPTDRLGIVSAREQMT